MKNNSAKHQLKKILSIIRVSRFETQIDMARKLKITNAYLSKIECSKNKNGVPKDFFKKIINNYDLSILEETQLKEAIAVTKLAIMYEKLLKLNFNDKFINRIETLVDEIGFKNILKIEE